MKMFNVSKWFCFVSILVAALVAISPSPTMAGGGGSSGIEPGGGCGEGLKYDAPPFMGSVTLQWYESITIDTTVFYGAVLATGELERVGNTSCSALVEPVMPVWFDLTQEQFQNFKGKDLMKTCLEQDWHITTNSTECGTDWAYFELIAVGNIKVLTPNTITVNFIVMPLQ